MGNHEKDLSGELSCLDLHFGWIPDDNVEGEFKGRMPGGREASCASAIGRAKESRASTGGKAETVPNYGGDGKMGGY